MNKKVIFSLFIFLVFSCRRIIDFDFDIHTQSLYINNGYFYDICFENDSVSSNGTSYEGALLLSWKDSLCVPPTKFYLDYIPNGYVVSRGGIPSAERKIRLKAYSVYTISSTGLGAIECRIKVWTNRYGKITKIVKLQPLQETEEE